MTVQTSVSINVVNQVQFRRTWLESRITDVSQRFIKPKVLDIGAGEMPYKSLLQSQGFEYKSHDFAQYDPKKFTESGLQDLSWPTQGYDFICDISELPTGDFDLALITEVLEHVPDPVKALRACIRSINPGGYLLISVPFNSRMHQAPFWFASGLSEYFFKHFEKEMGYTCLEIHKVGDFVDYITQELTLCFSWMNRFQKYPIKILHTLRSPLRRKLSIDLLSSGGLNLLVLIRRT